MVSLESLLTEPPVSERDGVRDYVRGDEDYCENFGLQWSRFRDIQIDELSRSSESAHRFWSETGWDPAAIEGKLLLDAGCGAGRFAEIALEAGARVVAVDFSAAAYACARTLRRFPRDRYLVVRASIFALPLAFESFDGVYSLGVLHQTPDPPGGIQVLARYLRPDAVLATWIYERKEPDLRWLQPRTWIRRLVSGWSLSAKLGLSGALTGCFFPLGWLLSWLGRPGEMLSHILPYAARHHLGRGDLRRQWRYCLMDTLDWYGPVYDQPQRAREVRAAMTASGLVDIRRLPARGMALVARRPKT